MKIVKRVALVLLIVVVTVGFVLPAVAFGIVKWGILPPEKLTPLVTREANKYLNGYLECESIELTYFDTYPYLGVKISNGTLVSEVTRDSLAVAEGTYQATDSLVSFKKAVISVNPGDYFFNDKITIAGIFLDAPCIYAYIDEKGEPNWEVYTSEPDPETLESDSVAPLPPIDLQKVRIRNGHFIYDDRQGDIYAELDSFSLRLNGSLTQRGTRLDVEAGTKSVYFDSPDYTLENKLALRFKSKIGFGNDFNTIGLRDAELLINELPFTANGYVVNVPDSNRLRLNMELGLKVSDLNDLLSFVPDAYFKDRKKIKTTGAILLESKIHGVLGDSTVPTIDLSCKVEKGSYYMKGVKQGIDDFEMDMDLHLNGTHPDASFVRLDHLKIEGLNTAFSLRGKVENIYRSPLIEATMKGKIDFTRLAEEFLNPDSLLLRGGMEADLAATFSLDDLLDGKYDKVQAAGKLKIEQLRTIHKSAGLYLFLSGLNFSVDSVKQGSSFIKTEELLAGLLTVDSMDIRYKRQVATTLKNLEAQAKTSPVVDTASVVPLTTQIKIERLRTRLPDSVWVIARNSVLQGGIRPSASNKQIPNIAAAITMDTLRYFDAPSRTGMILAANAFNIEALPYRDALRQRNLAARRTEEARRNSREQRSTRSRRLQQGEQSRSSGTSRQRRQAGEEPNGGADNREPNPDRQATASSRETATSREQRSGNSREENPAGTSSRFLQNWEVRGSLKFEQLRLFTNYFPLRMRMEQTTVRFDTDKLTLSGARFHAGKSNFVFNGELSSIRRALMRGGTLKGNFSIQSDYIDCNQLISAMNRGMVYAERLESGETEQEGEAFAQMSEEELERAIVETPTDTIEGLLQIPALLDLALKLDAKKIDVQDLNLENVSGELVLRNQTVSLKKLDMDSNVGNASLTMIYSAKDPVQATTGFELKMDDILVDRLIGLFPAIDSLLPMLRSFEGVVDCQMAATCILDSTMSVVLPSLHAACYLHGENMVLLDGETFAEISKTLMFKNKKRNIIDSISVDLVVKENKLEVYPFLVEMDRYRVAVGGEHNIDMTFDYHLSVLKSPVPFKLGIDIKGDLDDFKYKIVRCRYKDIFKPAREAELDVTRTNLRTEIREVIRKEMEKNAPELLEDFNLNQSVRARVRPGNAPQRPRPVVEEEKTPSGEEGEDENRESTGTVSTPNSDDPF